MVIPYQYIVQDRVYHPRCPITAGALGYCKLLKGMVTRTIRALKAHHIYECPSRESGNFSLQEREVERRSEWCIQIPEGWSHRRDLEPTLWTKRLGPALWIKVTREIILAVTKEEFPIR